MQNLSVNLHFKSSLRERLIWNQNESFELYQVNDELIEIENLIHNLLYKWKPSPVFKKNKINSYNLSRMCNF
jgi:hypothetical protein